MPEQCVCRAHARCNVRHPPAISMLTSGRGSCVVYGFQSHLATAVSGLFEGGLRVCGCENASTASLGSFAGCEPRCTGGHMSTCGKLLVIGSCT